MDKTTKHAMKWGSAPFAPYRKDPAIGKVGAPSKMVSPAKHVNKHMDKNHPHNKRKDHDESIHSHKGKK